MSDTERIPEEEKEENTELEPEEQTDADDESSAETEDASVSDVGENTDSQEDGPPPVDYARLAEEDMKYLISVFPHLEGKKSVAELDNPLRYAALRDLGLSPIEAYLATNHRVRAYDNRSHLQSSVPLRATAPAELMGSRELEAARELFAGLSDREIQRLYKKVSK